MNLFENNLLTRIKKDDNKAFRILFEQMYNPLCTFAEVFIRKSELAEEVVQDIFIKFWNSRHDLDIKISLKAYLYRMVRNQSLNYIRDNATRKNFKEEHLEELSQDIILQKLLNDNSVLDQLHNEQIESDLSEAMNNLPDQCRKIFELARFQNKTYPEIAQTLDISLSTVKTQMSRAMDKLHVMLKKHL
jgi:RNA polymerase sigma-70 factor, ECF subfamily